MHIINPLNGNESRTIIYVTDPTPITFLAYGSRIPYGTILKNHNDKIAYDISGLYLVDYTIGDKWYDGSVIVAK